MTSGDGEADAGDERGDESGCHPAGDAGQPVFQDYCLVVRRFGAVGADAGGGFRRLDADVVPRRDGVVAAKSRATGKGLRGHYTQS